MEPPWKEVELRLQKVLLQLGNEITIFERLMYKNTNQHRRALYFRRLCQVRRDLRLLQSARLTELVQNSVQCLRNTSNESSLGNGNSQSKKTSSVVTNVQDLRRRLYGIARLLEQMSEPIVRASLQVAGLLGQTFFMPFALTAFSALARLRVLVQQALHDFVLVFNVLSACPLEKLEKDDNHSHKIPDFLDCKWDGTKLFLASTFTHHQQERKTEKDYIQWFVDDRKGRKYDVLGSLVPDFEGDTAADSTKLPSKGFGESVQSAGFTHTDKNDLFASNSAASIGERTDVCGNVQQPNVSISEEERKGTSEDHSTCTGSMSSISGSKKKVAYVSILAMSGPESEKSKEQNPHPKKQKKDALFDMLLGVGGKTHDTLF